MSIEKKVSYLAGLAEGLEISEKTPEGKLLLAIVDILDDMAEELKDVKEYTEELDDDLLELEEYVYDDDDCDCDDCCDYDRCDGCECDGDCDDCDCEDDCDEYECPKCHELVSFSGDFADDELVCPNCGEKLAK